MGLSASSREGLRRNGAIRNRAIVRLCSDRVAYEAKPSKPRRYDLAKIDALAAQSSSYERIVFTPYLIVLRKEGAELTMAQDGRLIIRKADDEQAARELADQLYSFASSATVKEP